MEFSRRRRENALLLLIVLMCSALYQHAALRPKQDFLGFDVITWPTDCRPGLIDSPPFVALAAISVPAGMDCRSEVFTPRGSRIELEYNARGSRRRREKLELAVLREDDTTLERFSPVPDEKWHIRAIDIEPGEPLRARVVVRNSGAPGDELLVRSRLNAYSRDSDEAGIRRTLSVEPLSSILFGIFAGACVLAFFRLRDAPRLLEFAAFLTLGAAVHYRPYLTFSFDEWYLLDRIMHEGFAAALIAHNEHFIPVAAGLYALEYYIFGAHYQGFILVSIVLHVLAAMALRRFFDRVLVDAPAGPWAAALLSGMFLVNGLHAEALQWCMCQGTVLATLASILAMNSGWDYAALGRCRALGAAVFWTALALFSFAGSFILVIQLPLIGYTARLMRGAGRDAVLRLTTATAGACFFAFVLYSTARDAGGLKFTEPEIAPLAALGEYVARGAQFGTVLRGLGFFPRIDHPTLPLAVFGTLVSAAILFYALLRREQRTERVWLWFVGEVFLFLPFIVTAIGRAHFGVEYAVRTLRYQTPALIGLMILAAPLVADLAASLRAGGRRRAFAAVVLVGYCAAQLSFVVHFKTFREVGALERKYLQQLAHWRAQAPADGFVPSFELLAKSPGNYPIVYRGDGERAEGILTPIHPAQISEIISSRGAK